MTRRTLAVFALGATWVLSVIGITAYAFHRLSNFRYIWSNDTVWLDFAVYAIAVVGLTAGWQRLSLWLER